MTTIPDFGSSPVRSIAEAAALLYPSATDAGLIGIESEAFLVDAQSGLPAGRKAFEAILTRYKTLAGFANFTHEGASITGLTGGTGLHRGADITAETGFQPEYGGAPKRTLTEVADALDDHLTLLSQAAAKEGYVVTFPGLHPLTAGFDLPIIDKERYHRMTLQTLKNAGIDGVTAMRGTTGTQYNLDTARHNWATRYRVAYALQPFVSALSGNSPYLGGEATGHASHRSVLWFKNWGGDWSRDIATTVFADDFSPEKLFGYIAQNLKLPLLVRKTDEGETVYINVRNKTFNQLLVERPEDLGELNATDVAATVGFAFLPVKPKLNGILELRGPDGSYPLRLAQGALAVGVLYDAQALAEADLLLRGVVNGENYQALASDIAARGLNASLPHGNVAQIAQKLLRIAHGGLVRRGFGEEVYLAPLAAIAAGQEPTPGQALVARTNQLRAAQNLPLRTALAQAFLETALPAPHKPTATHTPPSLSPLPR